MVIRKKEKLRGLAWSIGIRFWEFAKHWIFLGPLEVILLKTKVAQRLIRPPETEIEVTIPYGLRLLLPPGFAATRSYASHLYERALTKLFGTIVKPGMTVLDAGANVGYYTLIASRMVGSSGRVYAFEPDDRNFVYLTKNVHTNSCTNVSVIKKALSDKAGSAKFIVDKGGTESRLSSPHTVEAFSSVETTALDDFFAGQGWPQVDLIKMDIEGSENNALKGAQEVVHRNPHVQLIIEFDSAAITQSKATPEMLFGTLRQLGFRNAYVVEKNKLLPPNSVLRADSGVYHLLLTRD